jgi:hypothetical protein
MYGNVKATCTMNTINGILMIGRVASSGMTPALNPNAPPIPDTVVHVINVANPNPDVGITRGRVTMSSTKLFPGNDFRASTYAKGIPKIKSKSTVNKDNRNEKKRTLRICSQFSLPMMGLSKTSILTSFHRRKT